MVEVQGTSSIEKRGTMKILHVSSAKSWRGGEQQIAYLLEELLKRNIPQEVFCPVGTPLAKFCDKNNITYTTYQKRFSVNPFVAGQLAKLVAKRNIDLIHLHDSHAHTFGCMATSFFGMTAPMVLHRRVDYRVGGSSLSKWKYNHPNIKAIICVSHFVKEVLSHTIQEVQKIKVVHSGVDLNRFPKKERNKLREEFSVPDNVFLVANVAAITEQKDYHTFVRTVVNLQKEKLPILFFIIGEGKQRKEIEDFAKEQGVIDSIVFIGFRNDIEEIFPDIDLLLFTSRMEGLGTTLLDAQLCGVPIVATRVGGIPEIVSPEKTGLLAERGDDQALAEKVKYLLMNKSFREEMVLTATAAVNSFSKENMAEGVLKTYKEVLD